MLKYIKPCNEEYEKTASDIAKLFEAYCDYMSWDLTKYKTKCYWVTLMGFVKGEYFDYHSYLLYVYNDIFNNKDKVSFQEFYKFITDERK